MMPPTSPLRRDPTCRWPRRTNSCWRHLARRVCRLWLFSGRTNPRLARGKPIIWGLGGHVIKVGLGPVLTDLMRRGYVTAVAMNGASLIHDFEIALVGRTSEDVPEVLGRGRFGMAEETGRAINEAIVAGDHDGLGVGAAVGRFLARSGQAPFTR